VTTLLLTQSIIGLSQDSIRTKIVDTIVVDADTFCYNEREVRNMYKITVGYDSMRVLNRVQDTIISLKNKIIERKDIEIIEEKKKRKWYVTGGVILGILTKSIWDDLTN
jgi:hypothetical protein